jgi:hypothetical protein
MWLHKLELARTKADRHSVSRERNRPAYDMTGLKVNPADIGLLSLISTLSLSVTISL